MEHAHINENKSVVLFASCWALGTAVFLAVLKGYAFYMSGSASVLATLVDSVVDVMISALLFFAIRYSYKPADNDHRYGHGKMEGVASLFQGSLMAGAGLFVIFEAINRFQSPVEVTHHSLAMIVVLLSLVLSFIVLVVQRNALKKTNSLILEADSAHYKTDIFLNSSVILALAVHYYSGPLWVDPVMAILIAGYFFYTSYTITLKSLDILMDKELPDATRRDIIDIVQQHDEILGIHDLRTRDCGKHYHISFDVELDKNLSLERAHDIVRELDEKILKSYPNAEIIIHMDPEGDIDDARHSDCNLHH